jgi:hypothetical protein
MSASTNHGNHGRAGVAIPRPPSPTFRLIPRPDRTFNVAVTLSDGRCRTLKDFDSEHEARAWVVQARQMRREALR